MEQLVFPVTKKAAEKQGGTYSSEANKNALFPSRLRELRKEKGVSQDQLSKELGVSKSTIGLYETGDTLPDAKTLRDLAVYFDASADWLLGLSDVKTLDKNIRNICEYTGISENNIKWISRINLHQTMTEDLSKQLLKSLNDFIMSDDFPDILVGISNIRVFIQKAKKSQQSQPEELSDQWKDMYFHINMAENELKNFANETYSVVPNSVIIDSIKFSLSNTFNNIIDKLTLNE